jgi:hypothetical protein
MSAQYKFYWINFSSWRCVICFLFTVLQHLDAIPWLKFDFFLVLELMSLTSIWIYIVTWRLKARIVDPGKEFIAKQRPVNTFPQQPKHSRIKNTGTITRQRPAQYVIQPWRNSWKWWSLCSPCWGCVRRTSRRKAEVVENHENDHVCNIRQGKARHRKYKRFKLGSSQAYNHPSD